MTGAILTARPRSDALPGRPRQFAPCGHPVLCGCAGVAACCELCDLPVCRYELHGGLHTLRARLRREEIARLRRQGWAPAAIAERLGITKRTVFRAYEGSKQ